MSFLYKIVVACKSEQTTREIYPKFLCLTNME